MSTIPAFGQSENISEVISFNESPTSISSFCFLYDVEQNAVLYVPEGTMSLYASLGGWNEFLNIQELTPTGVATVFDGHADNAPMYDLQGRKAGGCPAKGLYIRNGKKYVVK